jgi:uncharacterized protein YpuA (DUF1002 family)
MKDITELTIAETFELLDKSLKRDSDLVKRVKRLRAKDKEEETEDERDILDDTPKNSEEIIQKYVNRIKENFAAMQEESQKISELF